MDKKGLYKGVKIVGMISYIPFILALSPIAGYFAGNFLVKRFSFPCYTVIIFIAFSFIAGALETIRIIKKVSKMEKK